MGRRGAGVSLHKRVVVFARLEKREELGGKFEEAVTNATGGVGEGDSRGGLGHFCLFLIRDGHVEL